jgi:cyclic pyranopterin phosphate synthase
MVDVSGKSVTLRTAHARAYVLLPDSVAELFSGADLQSKKGPVFQTAIIAGITASKKTYELIPMCHPIGLEDCTVDIKLNDDNRVQIDCFTKVSHKTGVEMEALVGATTAALTVYDMCKGVSHDIVIEETRLIEKRGGKSDYDSTG